jgi:hypothetical protein
MPFRQFNGPMQSRISKPLHRDEDYGEEGTWKGDENDDGDDDEGAQSEGWEGEDEGG